ncbi:MAG: 30S ribosome-binding factor RbfA [Chloroflexi bacterium]|nr:30S ribosome-binding factor RbfA [Chloroflexota bacterium]
MTIKQERAAHLIHNILSDLLMNEVSDPALLGATITDVKVDREIEYADIYVHSLDDMDEVMDGLERANGYLRRELAARTRFRRTPVLHFHWDVAIDHGERIDSILDSLHDTDADDAPSSTENTQESQGIDDDRADDGLG